MAQLHGTRHINMPRRLQQDPLFSTLHIVTDSMDTYTPFRHHSILALNPTVDILRRLHDCQDRVICVFESNDQWPTMVQALDQGWTCFMYVDPTRRWYYILNLLVGSWMSGQWRPCAQLSEPHFSQWRTSFLRHLIGETATDFLTVHPVGTTTSTTTSS